MSKTRNPVLLTARNVASALKRPLSPAIIKDLIGLSHAQLGFQLALFTPTDHPQPFDKALIAHDIQNRRAKKYHVPAYRKVAWRAMFIAYATILLGPGYVLHAPKKGWRIKVYRTCATCGRPFLLHHSRQKYCKRHRTT